MKTNRLPTVRFAILPRASWGDNHRIRSLVGLAPALRDSTGDIIRKSEAPERQRY